MRPASFALLILAASVRVALAQTTLTDDDVRRLVHERIAREKRGVAIVVGLVDDSGTRVIAERRPGSMSQRPPDGDSLFRIASVTKVFTTTLLADMVAQGKMDLNDPISMYLPKEVKAPTHDGQEITLLHLATHTSGLPHNLGCLNILCTNHWLPLREAFSEGRVYAALSRYTPKRAGGARYDYSNFGMALLGHVLTRRVGTDYETLLRTRVLEPLGMRDTGLRLAGDMRLRYQQESARPWFLPFYDAHAGFSGAGGLFSSVNDLLKFVAANMRLTNERLRGAMQSAHGRRRPVAPGLDVGLGWDIFTKFGREVLFHNGHFSDGYSSFIGFDAAARRGVVVLSNSKRVLGDFGLHLIDGRYRVEREHRAVALDARTLDAYVGEYRYKYLPNAMLAITRRGTKLYAQATGGKRLGIAAEDKQNFFFFDVPHQALSFVLDVHGTVRQVVHYEGNVEWVADKLK